MLCAHSSPLSIGFPRQEYWSKLPFPTPTHLHDPGIEPVSLMSPALWADSLPPTPPGKSPITYMNYHKNK